MNYVTNEQGEVKIRSKKGQFKWVQKKLAEDKQLMKTMGFEVVEPPLKPFAALKEEPVKEQVEQEEESIEETNVAEAIPAKRGCKPNK